MKCWVVVQVDPSQLRSDCSEINVMIPFNPVIALYQEHPPTMRTKYSLALIWLMFVSFKLLTAPKLFLYDRKKTSKNAVFCLASVYKT